jgi:amino-acid N-acetyltransferase
VKTLLGSVNSLIQRFRPPCFHYLWKPTGLRLDEKMQLLPFAKNPINNDILAFKNPFTLAAKDHLRTFRQIRFDDDLSIVYRILKAYQPLGYLKPRTETYLEKNRDRFYITSIDGIVAGCVEQKIINNQTVELGALAISNCFCNQRMGLYTVNSFLALMKAKGFKRFLSLTNNPRLKTLFHYLGFVQEYPSEYQDRQAQSPHVKMFFKTFE